MLFVQVVNLLLAPQVNSTRIARLLGLMPCLLLNWLAQRVLSLRGFLGQLRAVDLHHFVHPQVRGAVAGVLFADGGLLLHALLRVLLPAAEVVRPEHVPGDSEAVLCAVPGLSWLAFLLLLALRRRARVVLLLDFRGLVAVSQRLRAHDVQVPALLLPAGVVVEKVVVSQAGWLVLEVLGAGVRARAEGLLGGWRDVGVVPEEGEVGD